MLGMKYLFPDFRSNWFINSIRNFDNIILAMLKLYLFWQNAFYLQRRAHMWAPILNFTILGCVALFCCLCLFKICQCIYAALRKKLRQQVHIHAANKMKSISLLKSGSPPAGVTPRGVAGGSVCARAILRDEPPRAPYSHYMAPFGSLNGSRPLVLWNNESICLRCTVLLYRLMQTLWTILFYMRRRAPRVGRSRPSYTPHRLCASYCWKFCQSRRCDFKWVEEGATTCTYKPLLADMCLDICSRKVNCTLIKAQIFILWIFLTLKSHWGFWWQNFCIIYGCHKYQKNLIHSKLMKLKLFVNIFVKS